MSAVHDSCPKPLFGVLRADTGSAHTVGGASKLSPDFLCSVLIPGTCPKPFSCCHMRRWLVTWGQQAYAYAQCAGQLLAAGKVGKSLENFGNRDCIYCICSRCRCVQILLPWYRLHRAVAHCSSGVCRMRDRRE